MSETTKDTVLLPTGRLKGGELKMIKHTDDENVYCECIHCDPDRLRFATLEEYLQATKLVCPSCGIEAPSFDNTYEQEDWLKKHGLAATFGIATDCNRNEHSSNF